MPDYIGTPGAKVDPVSPDYFRPQKLDSPSEIAPSVAKAPIQRALLEQASASDKGTPPTSKSDSPILPLHPPSRNPRVFPSKGFASKRSLSPTQSEDSPAKRNEASTRRSRYSSNHRTFAPGSIVEEFPTLSPVHSAASNPFTPKSSGDADGGTNASSSPAKQTNGSRVFNVTPTSEQWETLARRVLDEVSEYMKDGLPSFGEDETIE